MRHASRAAATLAIALLATLATAAEPKVAGTWDALASTPEGEMASVLVLKQADGKLEAGMELNGSPRTVTDTTLEAGVLRFKVQYEGGVYDVELKVDGDAMEGTWQGGGYSGTLKAKRRP
jgi:hypothetical protein